jgi:hypothetical protein
MNSASMATNLLGRSVRLARQPSGSATDRGTIALVSIDKDQKVHFLILVEGKLVPVEDAADLEVLD